MTDINQTLFDAIEQLNNVARIPALRSIAHSSMAKCIGAIRQHIRDQARDVRNDAGSQTDLDQRNEFDENARAEDEAKQAMGFETQEPPLKQASLFHAVYDLAVYELLTISYSKRDAPLTVEQMLEFMVSKTQTLDKQLAQALADAAKTDIKTIERMHELQSRREREQLIEAIPEILMTFKGFGENGYEDVIKDLTPVAQHQLGVKVVEALGKARDQVLNRVLRTRRIAELGSVPILEDAAKQISSWVEQFEHRYSDELQKAIDAGQNIRTLEDVATD
jgi:hypothetical protein